MMAVVPRMLASAEVDEQVVMRTLAARGYQEVITYGFVDPAQQSQLFSLQAGGAPPAIELVNPIAADLAVMRTSLLPGLIGRRLSRAEDAGGAGPGLTAAGTVGQPGGSGGLP